LVQVATFIYFVAKHCINRFVDESAKPHFMNRPATNLKSGFLFILFLFSFSSLMAQVEGISIVSAENYYQDKDYRNALIGFEEYLIDIQYDRFIGYKAGICACRLGIGKRGVSHILTAQKAGFSDRYLTFWLGRAYHLDEQWDSASKYLSIFNDSYQVEKSFKRDAQNYLDQIERAREMAFSSLQPLVVENIGNGVNSVYSEFHPLLSSDGKMMVFTSRKKGYAEEKILDDGEYKEKIFTSRKQPDGNWSKAIPIRLVEGRNKDLDYNLIQFLDNDTKLLLYKMNGDDAKLYVSEYQNESWKLPYLLPIEPDPRFFTGDIVFTNDLKTVIFSNNGNTNNFQTDLYTSSYNEKTEKWSDPVFLSKNINSPEDEAAPFLLNSKTLIFSSKSKSGLGDFDMYKSEFDENTKSWGMPVNLGFPCNTPNNDFYYFSQEARPDVVYFSSVRGTTKGLTDIYKLTKTAITHADGVIFDETGKPVASSKVNFDDPENFQNLVVKTDSEGKFSVDVVAGQTYMVHYTNADGLNLEGSLIIAFPANPSQLKGVKIQLLPKAALRKKIDVNEGMGD
jgi:hypothetical protein